MSDESEGIVLLFRNIREALEKAPIGELNKAIIQFLNKKDSKRNEVDYVMRIVAREFGFSQKTLRQKQARGSLQDAKRTAYCLLHLDLGLPMRHIAKRVFFNWHTSVANGVKKLKDADPEIKSDKIFIDRYKKLQKKLVNHIISKSEE
jgi:chromosomal replication initiation ATPase DnaA